MKIAAAEVVPVVLPDASRGWMGDVHAAVVTLTADDGTTGTGVCATSRPLLFRSLVVAMEELAETVVAADPAEPERIHAQLVSVENFFSSGGICQMASSAIDTAVWDLVSRAAGLPLWRLLGGAHDRVRTYDSGSLVPSLSLESLQSAAVAAVSRGHRALKMRPGPDRDGPVAAIAARVGAVRDAIGPEIALMIDVNQGWTPKRSVEVIRALEPYDLAWVEDPTRMDDLGGQAHVTANTVTPICAGEYFADVWPLELLLEARAVDVLMIDLMRVGGVTPFRRAAAAAQVRGVPVVSHLFPEINAHLVAAAPNGFFVEHMPWTDALWQQVPAVRDGWIELPETPGTGLVLDADFVRGHRAW